MNRKMGKMVMRSIGANKEILYLSFMLYFSLVRLPQPCKCGELVFLDNSLRASEFS